MRKILAFLIVLYQKTLSPDRGLLRFLYPYGFCRHTPTCSEYAKHMLLEKGVFRGIPLIAKRLLCCNPWTKVSEERLRECIEA